MSHRLRCGLLGKTLSHSYSPEIHALLGDYDYDLIELEETELEAFLHSDRFDGVNVTIPYKKAVMPYLDEIAPEATRIGSVNTVVRLPDGKLRGHNTDYYGFCYMLDRAGFDLKNKEVLIVGNGGASLTTRTVAADRGAKRVSILTRTLNCPEGIKAFSGTQILVNTTPVGMYPGCGLSPVLLDDFPSLEGVADVIYNPERTALILDAMERGIPAVSGLSMLVAQAKAASELFTGKAISDDILDRTVKRIAGKMRNIVLVGMPGCGKSTVGRRLAEITGREFIDLDDYITNKAGCPIPQIFAEKGEGYFRDLETACLAEISKGSGAVLSMGGGTPIRPENRRMIRQNSTVVWLKREFSLLPKDGRPLSQSSDLEKMYEIRKPCYEAVSDIIFNMQNDPEENAKAILEVLAI